MRIVRQLASVGLFGRQGGAAYRIRPVGRHCILGPLRFCALTPEVLAHAFVMAFRLPLQLFTVTCPAMRRITVKFDLLRLTVI